jgi:hypothetical protein
MSKMGSHDPFEYIKHKTQEKGWPLKVKNRLDFFACRWRVTYRWKVLNKGYNFALDFISIEGLHTKFWAFKDGEVPISEQNDIWVLAPRPGIENTIRGKVVASLKSGPWWVLWICVCPWFVRALKVFQLCTNQLVIWFVQVCVNNGPIYHSSQSRFGAPTHLLTPEVLRAKECTPTPHPSVVFTLDLQLSILRSLGVR